MKYATSDKEPSEIFVSALSGGGGSSIYCNCGRIHYAPCNLLHSDDESDYQNMLDDVEAEKKENPDGVIINYEDSFVRGRDIDGRTFVDGCPCNGLRKYEDWIWNHRNAIRDYLKARIDQEYHWAQQELTRNKLAGL